MAQDSPLVVWTDRVYAHLAGRVKPLQVGESLQWRTLAGSGDRWVRLPLYGEVRLCALCDASAAVQAAWVRPDVGKLHFVCCACDSTLLTICSAPCS